MEENVKKIKTMVFLTAREASRTVLPVSDVVHKVLFEHKAPLFNYIQQRRFKGPHINLHPAVKHLDGLQPAHVFMELFVAVDLRFELMEQGRVLWNAVLSMGFHLLCCGHVPI